ncbi:MAG: ribonuclease Z [Methanobacterium sp.]|jgi:ribonuclease Z|nr:ribonuclease Z [Methanobacterium sp.]
MELTFLGTSSALPTKTRNHPAIALKWDGEIILMDCGEGTQRQISQAGLSPMKIKNIFISHLHGDHFLGLPGLIQSMAFRGRTEPLHVFGPWRMAQIMDYIKNLGYYSLNFPIYTHEVNDGLILDKEDYQVHCIMADHSIPNLAYRIAEKRRPKFLKDKALELGIHPGPDFGKLQAGQSVKIKDEVIEPEQVLGDERKGRIIVYSGDTRPFNGMVKFAAGCDVLIHESTFDESHRSRAVLTGHSTASDAARIAREAQTKNLILTHISTRFQNTEQLEKESLEIFSNSSLASDFMTYEVKRE